MTPEELLQQATAYWESATLMAGIELGVFNELAQGPAEASRIATHCGTSLPHTIALCDALCGQGLLLKEEHAYSIPSTLQPLLDPQSDDSMVDAFRFNRLLYGLWGSLGNSVRSGEPALPNQQHLGSDPATLASFVKGMHSRAVLLADKLAGLMELSDVQHLLDVAGGPGTISLKLLEHNPNLKSTVFDLPPIVNAAAALQAGKPGSDRLFFEGGDYNRDIFPAGFDAALYCGALHQETVASAPTVIQKIYEGLPEGARFILVDIFVDETRTQPAFGAMFELNMMLMRPSSHVFSTDEVQAVLTQIGFRDVDYRVVPNLPYGVFQALR